MGVIQYNNPPAPQLIRNSSFELPFGTGEFDNWYIAGDTIRQQEIVAFGDWAAKLTGTAAVPATIVQDSNDLVFSNETITISILLSGDSSAQAGQVVMTFALFDSAGFLVFNNIRTLTSNSDRGFNVDYVTMSIPTNNATRGRLVFSVQGEGTYYLDNAKVQRGRLATQWSPFPGELSTGDIPSAYQISDAPVDDPLVDVATGGGISVNLSGIFAPSSGGGNSEARQAAIAAGQIPVGGAEVQECLKEYQDFLKFYKSMLEKVMNAYVNRQDMTYFPSEEDKEILEFKRQALKKCLRDTKKVTSVQRGWMQFANNKVAAMNRAYEARQHSGINKKAFSFIAGFSHIRYLRAEEEVVRKLIEG